MVHSLKQRWEGLQQEIANVSSLKGPPMIVAVSKKQPLEKIQILSQWGQRHFAENYLQEAEQKMEQWQALQAEAELVWHFIGRLQKKKIPKIVSLFSWIQSVDSAESAEKIAKVAQGLGREPQILLQVNIAEESTKGGVPPGDVLSVAAKVSHLTGLRLRGLMVFPPLEITSGIDWHQRGFELFQDLQRELGSSVDTLSMGTSGDFVRALERGSTSIRVGESLFGPRT